MEMLVEGDWEGKSKNVPLLIPVVSLWEILLNLLGLARFSTSATMVRQGWVLPRCIKNSTAVCVPHQVTAFVSRSKRFLPLHGSCSDLAHTSRCSVWHRSWPLSSTNDLGSGRERPVASAWKVSFEKNDLSELYFQSVFPEILDRYYYHCAF